MIEIKVLQKKDWLKFSPKLQKLENCAEYPYGDDFFKLDHGENYFAFFERMGEPLFHVAVYQDEIVACGAGILRSLKIENKNLKVWYLCDLKVRQDFRGSNLTKRLMKKNILRNYLKAPRGYAISMNPSRGKNRVVSLLSRYKWFPIKYTGKLNFYSFGQDEAHQLQKPIESQIGKISFLSLKGKKDLIMHSTGEKLPLFHIQHGELAEQGFETPEEKGTYMICSFENSKLDNFLSNKLQVSATASILSHRMNSSDWNFILTSDI